MGFFHVPHLHVSIIIPKHQRFVETREHIVANVIQNWRIINQRTATFSISKLDKLLPFTYACFLLPFH